MIFSNFDIFSWVVLPLLILIARAFDVTLGTLRYLLISRGNIRLAPLVGFVESAVWILIMSGILAEGLSNPVNIVAYAGGFALGTFLGILLEERLSLGIVIVRVILDSGRGAATIMDLRRLGYRLTEVAGEGSRGNVIIAFSVMARKGAESFVASVLALDESAFYTIEDVKSVVSLSRSTHPILHQSSSPLTGRINRV